MGVVQESPFVIFLSPSVDVTRVFSFEMLGVFFFRECPEFVFST